MTAQQINDLLYDLKFSDKESEVFMNMIEYAKVCQENFTIKSLKPYIIQNIEKIVNNED